MNALTWIYLIWFFAVVSVVCFGAAAAAAIYLAARWCWRRARALWRSYQRRRAEREVLAVAHIDSLMRRGFGALSEDEVDELLNPKPITPRDFRVTERGKPVHFEDDHGSAA